MFELTTPIAFIIFNRPDTTARVFEAIAKARPRKLLVIADGARPHRAGEAERCAQTRAVVDRVDWDCEVLTQYSDTNLGCKVRVSSGLDWVFEQVPEAIILEDDCLPDPSFFQFCQEMLERYRDDPRIGMISGDNFQSGQRRGSASYYFSRYPHIWGWATWRRAWQHYDVSAARWPELRERGGLEALIPTAQERAFWAGCFEGVFDARIDTWDYQWILTLWAQGMLSVLPAVNLISNIGFGAGATHTRGASIYAEMPVARLDFPLRHPVLVWPHAQADAYTSSTMYSRSLARTVTQKVQALLGFGARG